MNSRIYNTNISWIAIVVAITFLSSTSGWAQSQASPTQKSETRTEISPVTVVVEHARHSDVEAITARYQKHTAATVVPIVVTMEEAIQMGLTAPTSPDAMSDAETSRYAERELAASNLSQFEGGDVIIGVSLGLVLTVLLIVLLVVILTDY